MNVHKVRRFQDVREMIEIAFDQMGGMPKFVAWGKKNPGEFYKLWSKLLPREIVVDNGLSLGSILSELVGQNPQNPQLPAPINTDMIQEVKLPEETK